MGWFDRIFHGKPNALPEPEMEPEQTAPRPSAPAAPPRPSRSQHDWETRLTDTAVAWRDALPEDIRPHHLAERFPRIANRLALIWADPAGTAAFLDELLIDKRGGRQGFPAPVADDLRRLRAHSRRREAAPGPQDA